MTHQEGIVQCIVAILSLEENAVRAFCRYDPFDKLLRSYSQCNKDGEKLYNSERAKKHCKMSKAAHVGGLRTKQLFGEHRVPISVLKKRLLESDGSAESVRKILEENEMVLITREEKTRLDSSKKSGGLGFRSTVPPNGICRLSAAGIEIAPETVSNKL